MVSPRASIMESQHVLVLGTRIGITLVSPGASKIEKLEASEAKEVRAVVS